MKYIAALLTVHNRKEKTLECLSYIFKQNIPNGYELEVYLTDDGCTDGTQEAIKQQYPHVKIINGDGNLFWNRGMWTAWEAASKARNYDYYLWLNDDTFIVPDAIASLLADAESFQNTSIIIGATVDTKTGKQITYGGRINGMIPEPSGTPVQVDYFNGNIVLIPNAVYNVLGNLDHYFTHSKGDFDYGMRAKEKGIKMYQSGKALGKCDEHESLDKWCNPAVPFKQRWSMLHRPNGMPPKETFHLEKRHYNVFIASFHYLTIYLRCLFPYLWRN